LTTCAYRDGILAWDSQITDAHISSGLKGVKDEKAGVIVTGAGDMFAMFAMYDWIFEGMSGPPPKCAPTDGFELLLLWKNGVLESMDRRGRHFPLDPKHPYAIGSGGTAAMAALLCGKTAHGAVEIASKCDMYTGGEIHVASW
jgi:hypothetical protein